MAVSPTTWFDRRFRFDEPIGVFPAVLERLRGTPARLEERVGGRPLPILTARPDGGWSVLEQIGHLGDLEDLWGRRLTDFLEGVEVLTEADLTNRRTHESNHNAVGVRHLLERFREKRMALVARLEVLGATDVARTALHPRLRTPMRTLDFAIFVAEHDDHHLARIGELLRGA